MTQLRRIARHVVQTVAVVGATAVALVGMSATAGAQPSAAGAAAGNPLLKPDLIVSNLRVEAETPDGSFRSLAVTVENRGPAASQPTNLQITLQPVSERGQPLRSPRRSFEASR